LNSETVKENFTELTLLASIGFKQYLAL